ncbi:MAG TPA: arginine decarboxylase [Phaeodactylibacter sp.]|nr:arginine decarboxylase [Phaeodactylibacter sp.]
MSDTYEQLLRKTCPLPQQNFELKNGSLHFHGLPLLDLVKTWGSPFKLTVLPHIRHQIQQARQYFSAAFQRPYGNIPVKQRPYYGKYHYCYCTKSNYFTPVLEEVCRQGAGLETSSAFDVDLLFYLHQKGSLPPALPIIHNGYKTEAYLQKILQVRRLGIADNILILDSPIEWQRFQKLLYEHPLPAPMPIGLRMATYAEPGSPYHTSRLGLRAEEILPFYEKEIRTCDKVQLQMLHFFVDAGIRDEPAYWAELHKALDIYARLKKQCTSINALNIGGGFPIQRDWHFDYDFRQMTQKIVQTVFQHCRDQKIPEPDIYTEFGTYTVGESGATVFKVLEHKLQNEGEHWYILDNSLLNTLPDIALMKERFLLLPLNHWDKPPLRVQLGGLTCDQADFYPPQGIGKELFLPALSSRELQEEPLYIAFLHTAAYQDALGGYGGLQHCLIPSPRQIFVTETADGKPQALLFKEEQDVDGMLGLLSV